MIFLLIFLAFMADRAGKWWAAAYLAEHGPTQVTPFFTLVETYNRGIAFGMFQGIGPLVGWLTIGILVGLFIYQHRLPRSQWLVRAGVAVLIGGALGNLVDRLIFGEVLDFIQIPLRVGIFNVGDMMIHLGLILIIVGTLFQKPPEPEELPVESEVEARP